MAGLWGLKATPEDAESFCVAARAVSTLELGNSVKNPVVRQLDFYGVARAVAQGEVPFVDKVSREVAALRLGQSKWHMQDEEAVGAGADTSPLAEPSVAALLWKAASNVVG